MASGVPVVSGSEVGALEDLPAVSLEKLPVLNADTLGAALTSLAASPGSTRRAFRFGLGRPGGTRDAVWPREFSPSTSAWACRAVSECPRFGRVRFIGRSVRPRSMIFNELTYFVLFLGPSVLLFHLCSRSFRPWIVLACFGLAFFTWYAFLTSGERGVALAWDCLSGSCFSLRFYRPRSWVCIVGIIQAVLILAFFKYTGFFSQAWDDLFATRTHSLVWRLFLPLGISFFTFEFIHFAADSYAGRIKAASMKEYAAFIFFFPSMVAGPIKRFQQFQGELARARFDVGTLFPRGHADPRRAGKEARTRRHVRPCLYAPRGRSRRSRERPGRTWHLGLRYEDSTLDFSAYSDVAIGSGMLFGIVLPENFRWPYCSRDIGEFWPYRWHVSLSQWIRDYV